MIGKSVERQIFLRNFSLQLNLFSEFLPGSRHEYLQVAKKQKKKKKWSLHQTDAIGFRATWLELLTKFKRLHSFYSWTSNRYSINLWYQVDTTYISICQRSHHSLVDRLETRDLGLSPISNKMKIWRQFSHFVSSTLHMHMYVHMFIRKN